MTPAAAVISAVYGAYDEVKPALPQEDVNCEWVFVTDDLTIADGHLGWRVIHDPQPGMTPMRAVKRPKTCPWDFTDALASIWIDGSVRVTSPRFAAEALALADPIAQFDHPDRDCIYDEADEALRVPKYAAEPIAEQAMAYHVTGHPAHWGLWAATVIARWHTGEVKVAGRAWADEIFRWSFEDQISQPYVLRVLGLRPAVLPGHYRDNQWLRVEASGKHR